MLKQFFEIKNGNFVASEKNKVNNVNLKIQNQGEIISLLGPSGVGKTTILRTIAGLQKLSSGEIFLKNKLISSDNIHIEPEKRNIALSFQDNSLFPNYKVIDNINFGKKRANGNASIIEIFLSPTGSVIVDKDLNLHKLASRCTTIELKNLS